MWHVLPCRWAIITDNCSGRWHFEGYRFSLWLFEGDCCVRCCDDVINNIASTIPGLLQRFCHWEYCSRPFEIRGRGIWFSASWTSSPANCFVCGNDQFSGFVLLLEALVNVDTDWDQAKGCTHQKANRWRLKYHGKSIVDWTVRTFYAFTVPFSKLLFYRKLKLYEEQELTMQVFSEPEMIQSSPPVGWIKNSFFFLFSSQNWFYVRSWRDVTRTKHHSMEITLMQQYSHEMFLNWVKLPIMRHFEIIADLHR